MERLFKLNNAELEARIERLVKDSNDTNIATPLLIEDLQDAQTRYHTTLKVMNEFFRVCCYLKIANMTLETCMEVLVSHMEAQEQEKQSIRNQ